MEFHETANIFPLMTGQDFDDLCRDIAANGLIEPIWTHNGKILDGRNRYRACEAVGVNPEYREYTGNDPLAFVISLNLKRRHLNESQRAVIASRLETMKHGGDRKSENQEANLPLDLTRDQAAKMMNVSTRIVTSAKAIEKEAPELLDKIADGKMTVHEAEKTVKTQKRIQEREKRRAENIQQCNDLYISLYEGNMIDILSRTNNYYDLVIADPPYNVTEIGWDKIGDRQQFIQETKNWLNAIYPHLNKKYNLFWFCSPKYSADIEFVFRELNMPIQSRIVWHRRNMAKGSDAKYKFIDSWEMIFHIGNKELNFPDTWTDGRFDVQVFAVPQTNFTDTKLHPTQKPLELIKRLVEYGSFPGECVLDPFAGSGTTGEAAIERVCELIELDNDYIRVIESRLGIMAL